MERNIKSTIGTIPYEIVWIDNSAGRFSICAAYNEGVRRSKYPFLCFMHEDIFFHSQEWGVKIKKSLEDQTIGAIGVIGGCFIGKLSHSWWCPQCCKGRILQGMKKNGKYCVYEQSFDDNPESEDVAAVDGLWMCVRRDLFEQGKVRWDDLTYQRFHYYDFDMSAQVMNLGLRVVVIDNVLIEHKSLGVKNADFYDDSILFHEKWNSKLPFVARNFSIPEGFDENVVFMKQYAELAKSRLEKVIKLSSWPHRLLEKLLNIFSA